MGCKQKTAEQSAVFDGDVFEFYCTGGAGGWFAASVAAISWSSALVQLSLESRTALNRLPLPSINVIAISTPTNAITDEYSVKTVPVLFRLRCCILEFPE